MSHKERNLICHADDYGYSDNVSRGIREAYLSGIVQSTSVMANLVSEREIAALQDECPNIDIGVHLNLTSGRPFSTLGTQTLRQANGEFYSLAYLRQCRFRLEVSELETEWRTQIETVLGYGLDVTHLDSHHHVALASPAIFSIFLRLAREYELSVRFPAFEAVRYILTPMSNLCVLKHYTDYLRMLKQSGLRHPDDMRLDFYDANVSVAYLTTFLQQLPAGVTELVCHPGYTDSQLSSNYNQQRKDELNTLTSPAIRDLVQSEKIQLVSYKHLRNRVCEKDENDQS